jgi:hypothetical protein
MRRALRVAAAATILAVSVSLLLAAGSGDVLACTGHMGQPGALWC